jgi:RNA polymerase sigma factor (sigma-70 family)
MYLGAKPEEAAECAQEALVKVLKNWTTVQHPRAWSRTTAAREYINRRFSAEESFEDVPATGKPLIAMGTDIDELVERHHILRLIEQLPPKQRQVMAIAFDGAKPAEIAKDLGLTSIQVRSNLRHARHKLLALLEAADKDENGDR